MIKITYNPDMTRVTIEGHAGSGEAGHDLVCASVSILAYTLALCAINMNEAGAVDEITTDLQSGDAVIYCVPKYKSKDTVRLVFSTICVGFEILAKEHPDYISYEIRGE